MEQQDIIDALRDSFFLAFRFFGEEEMARASNAFGYIPSKDEQVFYFNFSLFHMVIYDRMSILEWVKSFGAFPEVLETVLDEPFSIYRVESSKLLADEVRGGVTKTLESPWKTGERVFAKVVELEGRDAFFTASPLRLEEEPADLVLRKFQGQTRISELVSPDLLNHENARRLFLLWHWTARSEYMEKSFQAASDGEEFFKDAKVRERLQDIFPGIRWSEL